MLLEAENLKEVNKKTRRHEDTQTRSEFRELFTVPRNRCAMQASSLQAEILRRERDRVLRTTARTSSSVEGGFSQTSAILASFGFGVVNFVFAGPAVSCG